MRARFQIASGLAQGDDEAAKILDASRVGLARAYLQNGDYAAAAETAAAVPDGFVANAIYVNDPQSQANNPNF